MSRTFPETNTWSLFLRGPLLLCVCVYESAPFAQFHEEPPVKPTPMATKSRRCTSLRTGPDSGSGFGAHEPGVLVKKKLQEPRQERSHDPPYHTPQVLDDCQGRVKNYVCLKALLLVRVSCCALWALTSAQIRRNARPFRAKLLLPKRRKAVP